MEHLTCAAPVFKVVMAVGRRHPAVSVLTVTNDASGALLAGQRLPIRDLVLILFEYLFFGDLFICRRELNDLFLPADRQLELSCFGIGGGERLHIGGIFVLVQLTGNESSLNGIRAMTYSIQWRSGEQPGFVLIS